MPSELPEEFSDLNLFVDTWAKPTMADRNRQRVTSDMGAIRAFYDAIGPRMDALLQYFQRISADQPLGAAQGRLFYLGQAFMEIAMAIENFNCPDVPDGFEHERFQIVKG